MLTVGKVSIAGQMVYWRFGDKSYRGSGGVPAIALDAIILGMAAWRACGRRLRRSLLPNRLRRSSPISSASFLP